MFRSLVQWFAKFTSNFKRKGWVSVVEYDGNWVLFWDVFGLGWIIFQFTCSIHLSKLPRFSPSPGRQGHRTRPSILWMQSNQKKSICHSTLTARNRHKLVDPWLSPKDTCEWKKGEGEQTRRLGNGKGKRYLRPLSTHPQKSYVLNTQTKRRKELDKSKSFQIPPNQKHLCWKKTFWLSGPLAGCMSNMITRSKRRGIKFHSDGCASQESSPWSLICRFWNPPPVASMSKSPKRSRAAWTEVAINGASSQVAQTEGNWCGPTAGFLGGTIGTTQKLWYKKTPKASTVAPPNRLCRAWRCRFMKIEDKS